MNTQRLLTNAARMLRNSREHLIYAGLFVVLFLSPVISSYIHSGNVAGEGLHWEAVVDVWRTFAIYLVIFAIHNFVLAPLLVYRKRRAAYLLSIGVLVGVFVVVQCSTKPDMGGPHGPHQHEWRQGAPPDSLAQMHHDGAPHQRHRHHHPGPPLVFGQRDVIGVVVLVLLLGMNLAVKLYFKQSQDAKQMEQLERESLAHQLEYLKYQINPHFFMNTLNNIHALVDIDPEKAKTSIVVLSKMMRYILYEGNHAMIPLQREVEFISHYIELMRMRYTNKVRVAFTVPDAPAEGEVPPLLLITFVENAFKHGISYKHDSFVDVHVRVGEGHINFSCHNSKAENKTNEKGGVGLVNVRKRLDLLYGDSYELETRDQDDRYEVVLNLPLSAPSA